MNDVVMWHRPLPRGLIKYREVVIVIYITLFAMAAYAVMLGLRFNWTVAILFGIQVRIMTDNNKTTTVANKIMNWNVPVDILHIFDVR